MKLFYMCLAMCFATPVFSQSLVSPEVQTNGQVTFRLKAPNAKEVTVQCEVLGSLDMQKDDQGVWSLTSDPLPPDYYGYSFVVDGVRTIDTSNPLLKYNLLNTESQVHVPGPASLPWEVNDVPHGIVHRHLYKSVAAADERAFFVYTPPGYKASGGKHYPVLYLLHGFSDEASAWCSVGQANIIFDNLLARGQIKPMVVVMPLGYGSMDVVMRRGPRRERGANGRQNENERFRATLLDEVLPQVEKTYHVSTDRKDRAIAGLSMGGSESLTVGLNALDRFAWIGSFSSGGVNTNDIPNLDAKANDRLRLVWISCGKNDGLLERNRAIIAWLKSKDIHHTWTEVPGEHSWKVWRRNLADFAPLLFQ